MNRLQAAEQLRRVLQMFAASLNEEKALEVVAVYDLWQPGRIYAAGEFVRHGENAVGDPQLYKVMQAHTAQIDWSPDKTPALFMVVGLDSTGHPVWSQPAGAHDAYNKGDVVRYEDALWVSEVDGNVWKPGVSGWSCYE